MSPSSPGNDSLGGERARTLTASAIADLVKGKLTGRADTEVSGVAPITRARREHLSFLGDGRYAPALESSNAGVILITPELSNAPGDIPSRIVVDKPQAALLELLPLFYPAEKREPGIDPTARIGRGARIGQRVRLDAYAVVGDGAEVGDDSWIGSHSVVGDRASVGTSCLVYPQVSIYAGSRIGSRVILHSGVRVGSDGFGYVFGGGAHRKIPHVGGCIIEDDVEIGANTTIDRGSIDDTVIGAGTKIDNLVQIGHNVQIGKLCLIMAQVGIAGSARIGDACVLAGQAGLGGHINIGAGVKIAGQSGVFGDVPAGESWSGYPARPHRESLRATAALFKIAGMVKRLEQLLEERDRK